MKNRSIRPFLMIHALQIPRAKIHKNQPKHMRHTSFGSPSGCHHGLPPLPVPRFLHFGDAAALHQLLQSCEQICPAELHDIYIGRPGRVCVPKG